MSFQKAFIFDPEDLIRLWCHYTDGMVPLAGEVRSVGINPFLERFIGIEVASDEWEDQNPLHLRYDTKRVMSWKKNEEKQNPVWATLNETPDRQ